MPVEATVDTYGDLTGEGSVLVDFWGPRCQPCLAMMPTIAKLEEEAGGAVRVVKVNSAENREICRELRVFGLPTYVLMRTGRSSSASPARCQNRHRAGLRHARRGRR